MEIVTYNAAELEQFIETEQYRHLKVLPISRLRAVSHIRNPRVDPSRNLLYVAYQNNAVVGYRLLLCDQIYLNGQPESIGWFSCVWVDPQMRGKGIAKTLVTLALKDWRKEIIVSDPVPASATLHMGTGTFSGPITLEGIRLYVRSTLNEIIPNKKPALKSAQPLFKVADRLINLLHDTTLSSKSRQLTDVPNWTELPLVDDEMAEFIAPFQDKELFRRNKDDLNWITQYPWIREGKPTEEDHKYYFSSVAVRMAYKHIRVNDRDGSIMGYMLIAIRNNHLKVPYSYFKAENTSQIATVLWQLILTLGIDTVTVFQPQLVAHFRQQHHPAIFTKAIKRNYYVAHQYLPYFQTGTQLNFMEGDGDQAFT